MLVFFSFDRNVQLEEELEKASREYQNQLDQYQALGIEMATILSPPREK